MQLAASDSVTHSPTAAQVPKRMPLWCRSTRSSVSWQYLAHTIYRCGDCALQFTFPMGPHPLRITGSDTEIVLADAAAGKWHLPTIFIEQIRRAVDTYLAPGPKKVIDIGCGPGYLLVDLQKRGLDCYGIDFNPAAVRVAREEFGLNAGRNDKKSWRR